MVGSAALSVSRITVSTANSEFHHRADQPVPTQSSVMSAAPFAVSRRLNFNASMHL